MHLITVECSLCQARTQNPPAPIPQEGYPLSTGLPEGWRLIHIESTERVLPAHLDGVAEAMHAAAAVADMRALEPFKAALELRMEPLATRLLVCPECMRTHPLEVLERRLSRARSR